MGYKINQQLGEKIARERKKRNMTQEDLATKVKVQAATISNIERGVTDTSVYNIFKIAQTLKMRIRDLFTFR